MSLGKRLKSLRTKRKWTLKEVADKLELSSHSTYSNWEYDRTQPDYEMLKKIAELYEVSTDYLINGPGELENALGERLKKSRERRGLSQTDAAKRLNINNKTLSRYENGGSEPDSETLKNLAELYDVSTDFLLGKETDGDDSIPQPLKTFFRHGISGISENENELLKEEILDYLEFRKNQLLKKKGKN